MFGHFYNNSVRKLVVGFGTLFNEIDVKRYNADDTVKESLRVPLGYGPKEKFLVRLRQPASIDDDVKVRMTAPRERTLQKFHIHLIFHYQCLSDTWMMVCKL